MRLACSPRALGMGYYGSLGYDHLTGLLELIFGPLQNTFIYFQAWRLPSPECGG